MKTVMNRVSIVAFLFAFSMGSAQANPITPANDGTGTEVSSSNDNQFDIEGGTQAGSNQFHSFEKFGLNSGQVANFISNPNMQNIIGRVTGRNASLINGLIQVSGSNANLYLMNPAGIRFGSQAGLNVPGSFTATTGHGIQIGDYRFKALGQNDYANLVGEPSGIAFATDNAGAIVNEGELTVPKGEQIALVGGLVINTGTLEAPEGDIIIASVPDKQMVTITQEGSLLSLGLPESAETELAMGAQALTPLDLPKLLTGGDIESVATVELTDNGNIRLVGSDAELPNTVGTTLVSGEIDTSGEVGGNIGIFGEKVGVIAANIDASGTNGGGEVLMGGNYKGQGDAPNALRTLIDENSAINADALVDGDGGRVIAWADDVTGFFGQISARGGDNSGDGGFVEVSGKNNLAFQGNVNVSASNGKNGTLLLDPAVIEIVENGQNDDEINVNDQDILIDDSGDSTFTISASALLEAGRDGTINLEATERITFKTDLGSSDDSLEVDQGKVVSSDEKINNLIVTVDPVEAETGIIEIFGNINANELTLENKNGDIIIGTESNPVEINLANFIFNEVDFDSLSEEQKNEATELINNLDGTTFFQAESQGGKSRLIAPNGKIELFGGIRVDAKDSLTIDANRFRAFKPLTVEGNDTSTNGNLETGEVIFNIGVELGGDAKAGGVISSNAVLSEEAPDVLLTAQFLNERSDNKEPQSQEIFNNSEDDFKPDATISLILREDISFDIGDQFIPNGSVNSGIKESIKTFSIDQELNGSLVIGDDTSGNSSFSVGLISDDPNIDVEEDEDTDFELATVTLGEQTETGDYTFTPIEGTDTVLATRSGQVLSLLFTLPKDEEGNLIPIPAELFPELLTPDVFLDAEDWEIQDQ